MFPVHLQAASECSQVGEDKRACDCNTCNFHVFTRIMYNFYSALFLTYSLHTTTLGFNPVQSIDMKTLHRPFACGLRNETLAYTLLVQTMYVVYVTNRYTVYIFRSVCFSYCFPFS